MEIAELGIDCPEGHGNRAARQIPETAGLRQLPRLDVDIDVGAHDLATVYLAVEPVTGLRRQAAGHSERKTSSDMRAALPRSAIPGEPGAWRTKPIIESEASPARKSKRDIWAWRALMS